MTAAVSDDEFEEGVATAGAAREMLGGPPVEGDIITQPSDAPGPEEGVDQVS